MMDIETIRSLAPAELRGGQFDKHLLKEYVETLTLNWLVSSKWAQHLTFIGETNLPNKLRDVRHLLFRSEAGEKILDFKAFVRHW